jgi:hypothetical protein
MRKVNVVSQHHHCLTRSENAERRGEQERVRQPDGIDGAGLREIDRADKHNEQQDQHHERVALQPGQKPLGAEERA